MKHLLLAAALLATPAAANARPVVVELFTSLGCSSCPPADALLTEIAHNNPKILALSFNITYWNSAFFTDKDSLQDATTRQYWYASLANTQEVYTPEAVVDGTATMVGSDRGAVTSAIEIAHNNAVGDVPLTLTAAGTMLSISIGNAPGSGTLTLIGYDSSHTTPVNGGELAGATITETNVVRSITALGPWTGGAANAMTISRPAGEHVAILLQAANGAILGAASD